MSAKLTSGEKITGFVQGVCKKSGLVIIESKNGALLMVNLDFIEPESVSLPTSTPASGRKWPKRLPGAIETETYRNTVAKYARLVPVAAAAYPEAQGIYKALNKVYTATWCADGAVEVLDGLIRISPPYRPENAEREHADSLHRVRQLLQRRCLKARLAERIGSYRAG